MVDVSLLQEEHEKKVIKNNKLKTVKQVSEEYGIGERKLRELTHIYGFPCLRFGKKCMIVTSKLDEWLIDNIGKTL